MQAIRTIVESKVAKDKIHVIEIHKKQI